MAKKLTTQNLGFILLFLTALFLVVTVLFTVSRLNPVTDSRIEDCSQRIESLEKQLDSTKDESKKEEINKDITTYTQRIDMLRHKNIYYVLSVLCIIGFLIGAICYTQLSSAPVCAPISAIAVLMGIGNTYQFIFSFDLKNAVFTAAALIVLCIVYFVWRKINSVNAFLYYLLIAAVFGLLIANVVFGKEINGSRLWIPVGNFLFQPGELVKVLLILVGALSYRKKDRIVAYMLTALASCGVLLLLKDLGTAAIIFLSFLFMTFSLLDFKFSLTFILIAVVGVVSAATALPYVQERFSQLFNAMTPDGSAQQTQVLESVIFGGMGGLGIENSTYMLNVYSITSDAAIAGLLAIFGVLMLCVVMFAYTALVVLPNRNSAVYPSCHYITVQASILIVTQVLLNFLGSIDVLPFTGVVAPLISDGGSATVCFGILSGLILAAINPSLKKFRGTGI
ncbi:MAG: FtsW/RodA/SpoVE family cell cycle protein [Acutalibacteraceae bacterium]|nr:FtsW/RodA/SpoVE family cell cycle protein [Acutalibacteraceae bacterium]